MLRFARPNENLAVLEEEKKEVGGIWGLMGLGPLGLQAARLFPNIAWHQINHYMCMQLKSVYGIMKHVSILYML